MDEIVAWISELKEKVMENTQAERKKKKQNTQKPKQRERKKKKRIERNEDILRDLWGMIKWNNICIIGLPKGEEREKGPENFLKN